MKADLIDKAEPLSITKQCKLLSFSRSHYYYQPVGYSTEDLLIMRYIDEFYTENPTYGNRRMKVLLKKRYAISVGRDKIRKLMQVMRIYAIYPQKNLSSPQKGHKKYPYLLRGLKIDHVNQVWSTDITYIRLENGFCYLTAVIDWYSRKVLSWKLSNSMDSSLCTTVLNEALENFGKPEIFNTDQGSQYTSEAFTSILKENGIKISMDGKGRALDNIFVERLWRTIKQEEVYRKDYQSLGEARKSLGEFIDYYNKKRPHSSLEYEVPEDVYWGKVTLKKVS